jgi:hypothetical protein
MARVGPWRSRLSLAYERAAAPPVPLVRRYSTTGHPTAFSHQDRKIHASASFDQNAKYSSAMKMSGLCVFEFPSHKVIGQSQSYYYLSRGRRGVSTHTNTVRHRIPSPPPPPEIPKYNPAHYLPLPLHAPPPDETDQQYARTVMNKQKQIVLPPSSPVPQKTSVAIRKKKELSIEEKAVGRRQAAMVNWSEKCCVIYPTREHVVRAQHFADLLAVAKSSTFFGFMHDFQRFLETPAKIARKKRALALSVNIPPNLLQLSAEDSMAFSQHPNDETEFAHQYPTEKQCEQFLKFVQYKYFADESDPLHLPLRQSLPNALLGLNEKMLLSSRTNHPLVTSPHVFAIHQQGQGSRALYPGWLVGPKAPFRDDVMGQMIVHLSTDSVLHHKVFVTNIPPQATLLELAKAFRNCGELHAVELIRNGALELGLLDEDPTTEGNNRKGSSGYVEQPPVCGFLYFETKEGSERALLPSIQQFGLVTQGYAIRTQPAAEKKTLRLRDLPEQFSIAELEDKIDEVLNAKLGNVSGHFRVASFSRSKNSAFVEFNSHLLAVLAFRILATTAIDDSAPSVDWQVYQRRSVKFNDVPAWSSNLTDLTPSIIT